jgi:hypothetical protein
MAQYLIRCLRCGSVEIQTKDWDWIKRLSWRDAISAEVRIIQIIQQKAIHDGSVIGIGVTA